MPVMTTSRGLMRLGRRPPSGGLGRHQLVDLGAEVLHEEVLFGRHLAVIDFLRPFFQRHLDAEFLVDGKDDVEEIEAVDPEIVDRVAFRRDRVAVDLAGVGDDLGDFVERRGHAFPRPVAGA